LNSVLHYTLVLNSVVMNQSMFIGLFASNDM